MSTDLVSRRSIKGVFLLILLLWASVGVDGKLSKSKLDRKIPKRNTDPRYISTKKKIVLIHNFYRVRVKPEASNMLEMVWHNGAQEAAQKWAEDCETTNDNPLERWVEDFGSCGQNVFISSVPVDWTYAVQTWFAEHKNFTYGSLNNNLTDVRRYTQMVWYNSHRIGCGFHFCGKELSKKPFYNYVCNYCPIGNNPKRLSKPYAAGKPCENCSQDCKYKKLCTNSCPYADLWINCVNLNATWNSWLCGDKYSERYQSCRATCQCPYAIV